MDEARDFLLLHDLELRLWVRRLPTALCRALARLCDIFIPWVMSGDMCLSAIIMRMMRRWID